MSDEHASEPPPSEPPDEVLDSIQASIDEAKRILDRAIRTASRFPPPHRDPAPSAP